jgi:hypothetical protein
MEDHAAGAGGTGVDVDQPGEVFGHSLRIRDIKAIVT